MSLMHESKFDNYKERLPMNFLNHDKCIEVFNYFDLIILKQMRLLVNNCTLTEREAKILFLHWFGFDNSQIGKYIHSAVSSTKDLKKEAFVKLKKYYDLSDQIASSCALIQIVRQWISNNKTNS
jgi:hypothetical protein